MLFNSLEFLCFLPLAIWAYFASPIRMRWAVVLVSSYAFYMWWRPEYAILILASTLVDYYAAIAMSHTSTIARRRVFLALSLTSNLGLLFTFKYLGWATTELRQLLHILNSPAEVPSLDLLLPVGISFYTFQTLSYTIDVYRGHLEPERHLGRFAVFVSFWPQLVAGPIERATHLIPQLRMSHQWSTQRSIDGCRQIAWGMFKKVVVADRIALYVDAVYADPTHQGGWALLAATYLFAVQIYADFSGYSDIAIGSAKIMGIDLMENFRRPYFSRSIGEFWRRWHISLSTWFRDYVYIPLGGNRVNRLRWYTNLVIVFVVSGIWHGANWTFVVWGTLHGIYLIIEILFPSMYPDLHGNSVKVQIIRALSTGMRCFVTFHLVVVAWVFFRAANVTDAWFILARLHESMPEMLSAVANLDIASIYRQTVVPSGMALYDFGLCIGGLVVLLSVDAAKECGIEPNTSTFRGRLWAYAAMDSLVLATILFGAFGEQSFLYFQF